MLRGVYTFSMHELRGQFSQIQWFPFRPFLRSLNVYIYLEF